MSQQRAYLTLLALVLAVLFLLGAGITLAIHYATTGTPTRQSGNPPNGSGPDTGLDPQTRRDLIAAAPMLATTKADALGGTPALGEPPEIPMPPATTIGPEGIPTGYPQTAQGAAAQLGEILVSTLTAMDLPHAQRVERQWAQPGRGDTPWSVLQLIQAFHQGGQLAGGLAPTASVRVIPSAAQIKGSDGDDWHVVCVLLDVTYTFRDEARIGYGHCERMTWTGSRWLIAAGTPAAPGPSTWPGTVRAVEAGWRIWTED